jgi:hypothetical protein
LTVNENVSDCDVEIGPEIAGGLDAPAIRASEAFA